MRAGRYTLKTRLAVGGMGEVWLASDEGPHGYRKTVVIKRMLPEAAAFLDYFTNEARLGARLTHQNIVQVLDFFVDEGKHNIVMEYVEGVSVLDLLARGPLTPEQAVFIATQALKGLEFAHNATIDGQPANIVHRDLSPDNLLVSCDAEVKLTDFGIAKANVAWRLQTEAGFKGKWGYISPEALLGQHVDRRADVYGMGVVLYEMLARRRAFPQSSSAYHMTNQIVDGRAEPLAQVAPAVPPAVVAIVEQMMRANRYERLGSAAEAREALLRALPTCIPAERSLAELVQRLSLKRRRLTSPFLRADERSRLAEGAVASTLPHEDTDKLDNAPTRERTLPPLRPTDAAALGDERLAIPPDPSDLAGEPSARLEVPRARGRALAGLAIAAAVAAIPSALYLATHVRVPAQVVATATASPPPAATPGPTTPALAAAPATAEPTPSPPARAPLAPKPAPSRPPSDVARAAASGYISVERMAERTNVSIDGVAIGQAPIHDFEISPGHHELLLTFGGAYVPVREHLQLHANERIVIRAPNRSAARAEQ
jgi:serine/threonine-protein kinase